MRAEGVHSHVKAANEPSFGWAFFVAQPKATGQQSGAILSQ
jgi:hypothetical protein